MKSFTTFLVFASLINFVNLLDMSLRKESSLIDYVQKEHSIDYSVGNQIADSKPVAFKGYRAPAIISNR